MGSTENKGHVPKTQLASSRFQNLARTFCQFVRVQAKRRCVRLCQFRIVMPTVELRPVCHPGLHHLLSPLPSPGHVSAI
jgi:hypothetical protein